VHARERLRDLVAVLVEKKKSPTFIVTAVPVGLPSKASSRPDCVGSDRSSTAAAWALASFRIAT